MRVNPNPDPSEIAALQATTVKRQAPATPATDNVSLAGSQKLAEALKQTPEVRPEKVAEAKRLLQDPSYPSDAVLGKVAGLLAQHLQRPDKAG